MNQTAIMSFLGKPRNRVMLDTSYTNAFGRTPGKIASLLRNDPMMISGGMGMVGKTKAKAHAAALRALVREKQVSVKVLHEKGESPMVIITMKNSRGRKAEETARVITAEKPRKKRKYTRRTQAEILAEANRPKRKYTKRSSVTTEAAPVQEPS